jgi:hypothetical protein
MNEIKVGNWTLTQHEIDRLEDLSVRSRVARKVAERTCRECCWIFGIDPTADSVARDICEEIVLHGTPVEEVVAKLQRHLEGGQ